jgi:hypothetical protein
MHVASSLAGKITDDFSKKYPRTAYATFANDTDRLQMPELKKYLEQYQDPAQADNITKIQKELDDTHAILKNTMSSLLERGEKIDDLVAKSEGLSSQSKMFYTQVRIFRVDILQTSLIARSGKEAELLLHRHVNTNQLFSHFSTAFTFALHLTYAA